MASTIKVLGQQAPASNTWVSLYTVPAGNSTVASSFTVCNRGASEMKIKVAVRPAGAVLANQHYLFFDIPVAPYETFVATIGITLAATDVVSVCANSGNSSFMLFGEESDA